MAAPAVQQTVVAAMAVPAALPERALLAVQESFLLAKVMSGHVWDLAAQEPCQPAISAVAVAAQEECEAAVVVAALLAEIPCP